MADLATLQGRLVEAERPKHKLLTGSLRAAVSYNGENSVIFARDRRRQARCLYRLATVPAQIAGLSGDPTKSTKPTFFAF